MQKLRLLVAEDSVPMWRLICSMLAAIASEVVECGGGNEAVRLYFESRPDWVLMDLHMADGDGLDATREILRRDGGARAACRRSRRSRDSSTTACSRSSRTPDFFG